MLKCTKTTTEWNKSQKNLCEYTQEYCDSIKESKRKANHNISFGERKHGK